jgi:hypothetical protein
MKFSSPQHALRWAYETSSKPVGHSISHDTQAQAAMILSMCERVLPALHMAYIRVQFGREAGGMDLLAHHLSANFGVGIHSRRSLEKILRAYCGEKIGLRDIRKSMNCGMLKAVSYRNQAYDTLDTIHLQAMDRLREGMEKRGLIISTRIA